MKKLEEMCLLDDFLFNKISADENYGKEFAGIILKNVLGREIRFYHAKMDSDSIKSGAGFDQLRRTYVIMIMSYDPFDRGRLRYTVRRGCVEDPSIPYDDGSCTIYLYVHGKPDETDERGSVELQQMLHFMENTDREHAVTPDLEKIQDMVDHIKQSKEAQQEAMKIFEREQMLKEEGREEERANTDREKKRADKAENEVRRLSAEVEHLRSLLEEKGIPDQM